ncbi:MAG: NADH-quinone oxidoreductase subunit N [Solirubrobacterales bacterium]
MNFEHPPMDYAALSPLIALMVTTALVMITGTLPGKAIRWSASAVSLVGLTVTMGLLVWKGGEQSDLVLGTLRLDGLATGISMLAVASGMVAVLFSWREPAAITAGRGEYLTMLVGSVLGMVMLAQAQNLITFFIALEILSIPLYTLCAASVRRQHSLESGLKYLIIGSLGSATLLYGLALIYGASGSTDFREIADALGEQGLLGDPLALLGVGLIATGMAFKVSLAPFHQWTPDVYEGAPTPVTAFMAVATKAAGFAVFIRMFDVALGPLQPDWGDALGVVAVISMLVGNVGALTQHSVKRILAYSGVAQSGYMLVGVIVATAAGVEALVYYLAVYTVMNLAAFAVVIVRERETDLGDDIRALSGLGRIRPGMAAVMTIAMLGLAGLPGTAGFTGKLFLFNASVGGDYTWLGVAIAIGTMISLGYYLRIIAAMWMEGEVAPAVRRDDGREIPAMAGGAPEADEPRRQLEVTVPAIVAAVLTVFFGIVVSPLADWAAKAGEGLKPFL